tara:strand:+ start:223 stop:516 length:294 start_codon:yes stop_codon:yes gene_type:complete
MIDTSKYEGHTQGHWATTTRKGTWVVYTQDNGDVATMNDYEDAKLIADAPLLLEEVKRLRGLLKWILQHAVDAANERARLAIESHPNADEMLKELIE